VGVKHSALGREEVRMTVSGGGRVPGGIKKSADPTLGPEAGGFGCNSQQNKPSPGGQKSSTDDI